MTSLDEEASQVDAYLDELLALGRTPLPRALPEPIQPDLQAMAQLVQRSLARFHPSFRFEEGLAGRLALEARTGESSVPGSVEFSSLADLAEIPERLAGGGLSDIPFGGPAFARAPADVPGASLELRGRGGLLLGGAIASGVSIAGAALIARARRARAEQRWQELG